MTDERALLAAVIADPDADTPRLVYADWLDDRGGEANADRAEYIRLEVEAARLDDGLPPLWTSPARRALRERAGALEKRHAKAWRAPLIGRKGPLRGRDCWFHFERGFPARASAPVERWVAEGEAAFRLAPIVDVDVQGVTPANLGRLLGCGWLPRVRRLTLNGPWEPDAARPDWAELADGPRLPELAALWLDHGTLSSAGAARLAAADPFPALRRFSAGDTADADGWAAGLFGGRPFGRLDEVYFHRCGLGRAAAEAMAGSAALADLSKLSVVNQPASDGVIPALAGGRFWPRLRELVLWSAGLSVADLAALAARPPVGLRGLDLQMNQVTVDGVERLTAGPLFGTVEELDLSYSHLFDFGLRRLLAADLSRLRDLKLNGIGLGPVGVAAIAGCAKLAGLKRLHLSSNPVGPTGAVALADSPHLAGLEFLSLSNIRGKAKQRLKDRFGDRLNL